MLGFAKRRGGVVALVLVCAGGCDLPRYLGPQIQSPPPGFLLQNDSYQQRRMFPDRDATMHTAWIRAVGDPYSGIYINAHPGVLTIDDVAAAQDAAKLVPVNAQVTFGDIEPLTVDDRTAWGWSERLETPELGLDWVAYRTVVAYDTVSYAIEFYSGDPTLKRVAPDSLRAIVATFEVGKAEYNVPLIALLVGLALLALNALRGRSRAKADRLKSIHLVQVPRPAADPKTSPETLSTPDPATPTPAPPAAPPVAPFSPSGRRAKTED